MICYYLFHWVRLKSSRSQSCVRDIKKADYFLNDGICETIVFTVFSNWRRAFTSSHHIRMRTLLEYPVGFQAFGVPPWRLDVVQTTAFRGNMVITSQPATPSPLASGRRQVLCRWCCVFSLLLRGSFFQGVRSRFVSAAFRLLMWLWWFVMVLWTPQFPFTRAG